MPSRPLQNPDASDEARVDFKKRTRILVDESLGREASEWLRGQGYNVEFAGDVGLTGKSDEDVFAYASRERRIIWTHDKDFMDDHRFPEHRNPGVVVLPGGDGNQQAMAIGMIIAIRVFGQGPATWLKSKSVISPTGEMSIRRRHFDTGKITTTRYRMTPRRYAEEWEDE